MEFDGIWKIAGSMPASIYGLDLPSALAALPAGLDRDRARGLFLAAERPFVTAWLTKHRPPPTGS